MPTLPTTFILDVDGVFNDGRFYYTDTGGKFMKAYGANDHDALVLLQDKLAIQMISGDKRGFPITQKRISEDMHFPLHQVSTFDRLTWIKQRFDPNKTVYMGDGIFDALVFNQVAYGIAPANAFYKTREQANYVTPSKGGENAVAEACWHILETFFEPINLKTYSFAKGIGIWK